MVKYFNDFLLKFSVLLILTSCFGTKFVSLQNEEEKVPKWFIDFIDEDEEYLYSVATAISNDLQLSIEKAKMLALNNMAQKIKGVLSSQYNLSINSETPVSSGDIDIMVKNFSTKGFKEVDKEILKTSNNKFRTYLKLSFTKESIQSFDEYIISKR